MASKSKMLRKLEMEVRKGNKEMRPALRERLRLMERTVRELRTQIRRLQNIRYQIKRTQIPLLEDLKLSERLVDTIKDLDKEMVQAVKAKDRAREKELTRRFRRRDSDAQTQMSNIGRRKRRMEDIEKRWVEVMKALDKLSKQK